MEAYILDTSFNLVKIIDVFDTFIWTERYSSCGDFEMYTSVNSENISALQEDHYVLIKDSIHGMIIETVQINADVEQGPQLAIEGRSLESILDRRIVWSQTVLSGSLQNAIKKLLDENIINPTDKNRKIDNFIFEVSTDDAITSLELSGEAQFTGDNLYEVISLLCDVFSIGFRITLSSNNEFIFKLYSGVDRSYGQTENPYVVFSPDFENLLSSNYISSKQNLKTVTLVAGEGEGSERKTTTVDISDEPLTGINRRELYTDARDISQTVDGTTISDEEYKEQLSERGYEKLNEYTSVQSFEGEADPSVTYKYGTVEEIRAGEADYSIGDIVQIINEYGMEAKSRITEVIRSESSSGFEMYPTFTQIE